MGLKNTVGIDRKIYGDYKVYSPSGILMFICSEKKANWYLNRELAIFTDKNDIKLLFEPNGYGNHGNHWGLNSISNICVNCGGSEFLTRHHVVPMCYRKHFSNNLKNHNFHDVLLMCSECHEKYETQAFKLKKELAITYNAPINGVFIVNKDIIKMRRYASCLLHTNKIPRKRIEFIKLELKKFFKWVRLTRKRVNSILEMQVYTNLITHGKIVSENIEDYQNFIEMWRKHFLENNNCLFLPKNWSISYMKKTNSIS